MVKMFGKIIPSCEESASHVRHAPANVALHAPLTAFYRQTSTIFPRLKPSTPLVAFHDAAAGERADILAIRGRDDSRLDIEMTVFRPMFSGSLDRRSLEPVRRVKGTE